MYAWASEGARERGSEGIDVRGEMEWANTNVVKGRQVSNQPPQRPPATHLQVLDGLYRKLLLDLFVVSRCFGVKAGDGHGACDAGTGEGKTEEEEEKTSCKR